MVFVDVSNVVQAVDGIEIQYEYRNLIFRKPAGTSRGVLLEKPTWFMHIRAAEKKGIGECSVIPGLSIDYTDRSSYEQDLQVLKKILIKCNLEEFTFDKLGIQFPEEVKDFLFNKPSIQFGLEMALRSIFTDKQNCFFLNDFFFGKEKIPINGLVWMDSVQEMYKQFELKFQQGFRTMKFKIGALSFKEEIDLIEKIRSQYDHSILEIRVDANGAFSLKEVRNKLGVLSNYQLHSIEQPIPPKNRTLLKELSLERIVPIALDEELIGIHRMKDKEELLSNVCPQYIVLKPSLHGGINGTLEWIEVAQKNNIQWWITSALESSLGLEAIAQFTYSLNEPKVHGLGMGNIYKNNIDSELKVENGFLFRSL